MPSYVVLLNWTDQGVQNANATVDRFRQARSEFEQLGVTIPTVFWLTGRYDIMCVIEAPDDQTLSGALLRLAQGGNVRTETLRAFSEQEMGQILQRLG